ncbi:MAG: lipocalin family protein [Paludibacteraceae bacterium]|nr:lipocalin family protein [Paludibacteraceae bacterium]
MKKMNYYLAMLLMITLPVLFTSCEKKVSDDAPFEELIVGEWDMTRLEWDVEYEGEEEIGSEYFDEEDWIWEFDGNEINMYMEGDYDNSYRYEIENNKLYTEYATYYEAQYFKITTLNKNKLVLEVSYRYEGVTAKYTFVFKRI